LLFLTALTVLYQLTQSNTRQPAPTSPREAQRTGYLAEIQSAGQNGTIFYDWQNQQMEIVRLPIQRAMELTVQEWQDPLAARSNLLQRAAIILAVPPPLLVDTNALQPTP
jgi:hypothetical protein